MTSHAKIEACKQLMPAIAAHFRLSYAEIEGCHAAIKESPTDALRCYLAIARSLDGLG